MKCEVGPRLSVATTVQSTSHMRCKPGRKTKISSGDSCNGGNPPQNAYIERFNGRFRTEVLDASVFSDLDESTHIAEQWKAMYNEERPHYALGYLPPSVFRNNCQAP